jgi:uncharacterized protein (DUF885 family)
MVALDMIHDAIHYFSLEIPAFITNRIGEDKELLGKSKEVLEAWERYKKSLSKIPLRDSFAIGEDGLMKILSVSLSYSKSVEEILQYAQDSYKKTKEKLCKLASKIDGHKTWDLIIYEEFSPVSSSEEVLQLYQKEVQNLRNFFYSQDILTFPSREKIIVLQTPSYLQSLRATASYRAPITGNMKGHGVFYITPGTEDLEMIVSHCPYLSAHEAYPGHHTLDYLRVHHPNPIRRQIESPLFYEGWACYAERLLDEFGYIKNPRQQLIGFKRQLWRNLRAILDVKLQTGKSTLDQAAKEIEALGYSPQRAKRQTRRFALTPGYQLCYSMGNHEILRLREQFYSRFGPRRFHDILLSGGQLPFYLVERRLKNTEVQGK